MVHFVGAGPGDEKLITIKGKELIERADIVIYAGSLVNPGLLKYARESALIFNSAVMTLEEVIEVMEKNRDREIVRLHTGDQSMYGAVREQMDELIKREIQYDSTPGVSACFGAAAALDLEFTLPDVSQTLILTRMEGRTKVPALESIESLASHNASMAIYLSAGNLEMLSKRLMDGGYKADTPAALVYKATWPEEKKVICTVGTLPEAGKRENITKTAIVLVGDAIGHMGYERSRLYDPAFETEFRKSSSEELDKWRVICYTKQGNSVAEELRIKAGKQKLSNVEICDKSQTKACVAKAFDEGTPLIFICALGIAVRSISELVKDKLTDIPVIVIDDGKRYVIPVLSGHMGGANSLAVTISELINSEAVITTSTDVNDAFPVDVFAKERNLKIENRSDIRKVSMKAIEGRPITLSIKDFPPSLPSDIVITDENIVSYPDSMVLTRKGYTFGMGMKKGVSFENVHKLFLYMLERNNLSRDDIYAICTIDIKESEPALKQLSNKYRIPVITFDRAILCKLEGDFHGSKFVEETVGVDNICERAAAAGIRFMGKDYEIVADKYADGGVTGAIAAIKR